MVKKDLEAKDMQECIEQSGKKQTKRSKQSTKGLVEMENLIFLRIVLACSCWHRNVCIVGLVMLLDYSSFSSCILGCVCFFFLFLFSL